MLLKLVDLFSFFSVLLRAGTLVFQSLLLGGVFFLFWTGRTSPDVSSESLDRIQASAWRLLRVCAACLAAVQLLYLYVDSAVLMATTGMPLSQVIGANFFISGCIVTAAALTAAMTAAVSMRPTTGRGSNNLTRWALPALAAVVVGGSVMTNHAASRLDGRALLITLSVIHELATGVWIGGLAFLVLALFRAKDAATRWYVTERFSRMALVSVGALVLSGTIMSILYMGSWAALFGTAYGVMVTAKAVMLGSLLLLGLINYLLIRNSKEDAMPRLRRLIEAELGIGITVILTAASLTSQPPAIDQTGNIVTLEQIVRRVRPAMPRLMSSFVAEAATIDGANVGAEGSRGAAGETELVAYNVDGVPLTPARINSVIRSELNHHWMGLVVLAMGLFALLARTGKAPWAQYWPMLLVGIAVFIFLKADPECWPLGWKGFGACWADPEVFQHRIAAVVCVVFAVFETRQRSGKKEGNALALVFPMMTAIGGAVLLTHSHAIVNVKENLLVELSHVPMGIIAVFAGWSRWLELRLPQKYAAVPSWIWPVCFVLIGALLLNYREM